MASKAEGRMNLSALQQRDPYITDIVDTASQVALYSFSSKTNEWEKTEVEGTLFVYTRSASPINGFMILNRLGLHDLIEPINKNLEFQLQDPFLLYRNDKAIYGIWFYDKDECARIGQLMNSLVQIALENQEQKEVNQSRQRRASESDTMPERAEKIPRPAPAKNVDIIKMLSKAQDEYDKAKAGPSQQQKVEPKPMIDNPNASATKNGSNLIKPLAVKMCHAAEDNDTDPGAAAGAVGGVGVHADAGATTPTTAINLDALFRRASMQQQQQHPHHSGDATTGSVPKTYHRSQSMHDPPQTLGLTTNIPSGGMTTGMPSLLQRLMSNPGTTVEELERQHRGDIPRDQMPQPAGAEAPTEAPTAPVPSRVVSGSSKTSTATSTSAFWQSLSSGGGGGSSTGSNSSQPSPDTALKRSLNMLPTRGMPPVSSASIGKTTSTSPTGHKEGLNVSSGSSLVRTTSAHEQMMAHGPSTSASSSRVADTGNLVQRLAAMQTSSASAVGPTSIAQMLGSRPGGGTTGNPASEAGQPPAGVLLTPMAFEMSPRVTPTHSTVLPPPSVFQSAGSDGGRVSQASPQLAGAVGGLVAGVGHAGGAEPPEITPLTREQLQQALIYLVKNDQDFMRNIHEAYVKSLTDGFLSQHKS